ncbi:thiol-disulfide oxidoreductase DCC family protein [Chromobacterium phragmitis]|uniref:DCC1-like thiol-disulfide oxidoreductase family protein n=1 Tax=Chromobacterium phragmitis TaxID=2202141 RepID=A0ABV0IQ54_9NEIS
MNGKYRIFYDGDSALCAREMQWMRKLDHTARLELIDIRRQPERLEQAGLVPEAALARIHACDESGRLRTGVDALLGMWMRCWACMRVAVCPAWWPFCPGRR